ncbi:MAG TPA: Bax inhibitor-1/YccA family protein, partial [Flavobacteriales bacterium]|nr:Bax inhibitor-1/YccA family protein [Flavobacteriales bacterium]
MYQDPIDQLTLSQSSDTAQAAFMTKVYGWMTIALVITALAAMYTAMTPALIEFIFSSKLVFYGLIIGELLLVGSLVMAVQKMSPMVASLVFFGYAALNGLTLASIFFLFTAGSIALTFFITAGTFAVMSIYGYTTKADLTRIGNLALMALVGVIIASIANYFLQNETLYWIISYLGVAIFVGLVAYDTQKIKNISATMDIQSSEGKRASVIGALT